MQPHKICIHADDLGASKNINNTIKEGIDAGILHKVSLIMNGTALDEAVQIVKESSVETALHLNLSEGTALSSPEEIPLLVDEKGLFKVGYAAFWLKMGFNQHFKSQVMIEIKTQVDKYQMFFPGLIKLDSHQHYHMIPPMMRLLLKLHKQAPFIKSIRTIKEPFFFLKKTPLVSIQNYLSPNLIKWFLLRFFNMRNRRILKKSGIKSNDYFCGVLFSGNMKAALFDLLNKRVKKDETGELLFHPGQASQAEKELWQGQDKFYKFYISEKRSNERRELLSLLEY